MLLTETWLDQSKNSAILIESTPPNFNFLSTVRANKKGGGIANIFKASFQCTQTSFGDFASFEYLSAITKCSPNILLLTVYRPPRLSVQVFLVEFGELLSVICLQFEHIVISGDFNLHVDNPANTDAIEFLTLIDTFSLTQHVQGPTHTHGHILDLVITKGLNVSVNVMDMALSDHFCVYFEVYMSRQLIRGLYVMTVNKRLINANTAALFEQAFLQTPRPNSTLFSTDVDDMLNNFNTTMSHIMNNI